MKLDNVMIIIHAVYSLWVVGLTRSINRLHLIINDQGGIISVKVTTANVDDKKPVPKTANELWGCLYGDKDYISGPLEWELADKGVTLITGVKKI
uniref:transposase n=1 Tax=Candidatus Enterovibrio escicola TaxID=1927127 RepID=UPI00123813D9|nr:transposase [Candidatus Enterovibrio escacola]